MDFFFSFRSFVYDRLPIALRIGFWLDYLLLCTSQIESLHTAFLLFNAERRIAAGLTSSRKSLQEYLRDTFENQGINVVDKQKLSTVLIYREAHQLNVPSLYREAHEKDNPIMYREGNGAGELEYSFIVEVPTLVIAKSEQIKAIVNRIKPVNTNYTIVEI